MSTSQVESDSRRTGRAQKRGMITAAVLGMLGVAFLSPAAKAQGSVASNPWEELRPFLSGTQGAAQWFASTDPKHGNDDYLLLKPGETRTVPLASGLLLRLWSTALRPDKLNLTLNAGTGQGAAVIPVTLLSANRAQIGQLYQKAFTFYPSPSEVIVLRQGAALTLTNQDTQPNKVFYQVTVRPQKSSGMQHVPRTGLGTSDFPKVDLAPGKTMQLGRMSGAGYIKRITVTLGSSGPEALLTTRLRARWNDKAVTPGASDTYDVDVPLSAFIAGFQPPQPMQNAFAQFEGKQLVITWPMPFASGASVGLMNAGDKPFQGGVKVETVNTRTSFSRYRLHVAQGAARSQKGQPIAMLQVKGEGVFCGLALDMRPAADSSARSFAYLEGNETIEADGWHHEGTGTEDFFNSAWYFPAKPFAQPYAGMTYKSAAPPHVTAYRLMIPDAVPFKQQLAFKFEHGNGNNRNDLEYRWAAFWYQAEGGSAVVPDTLSGAGTTPNTGTPASGATQPDWKFPVALFGILMGAVGIFLVRRNLRRPSR